MVTPPTEPSPAQERALAARLRVGEVAVAFREHVAAGDLAGAWPLIDPRLRLAWARDWAQSHQARLRRLCPRRLADQLSCLDGPSHPLWKHFAEDRIHRLHQVGLSRWLRPEADVPSPAPDTEVLYACPEHPDAWGAPDDPRAVPVLMRWNGTAWKVLAYGSVSDPDSP